jgi:hypothetical protein
VTALLGFLVVVIIEVPLVCFLGRKGRLRETELPWNLVDVASRQVVVLGGLAGFAVTNIVLLVTFGRERAAGAAQSFDAVVTMFLVAYFFYVGTAVLMGFMPRDDPLSPLRPRVQFVLATILQYRTIFLGWLALRPLLAAFALDVPAEALQWLLAISALIGTLFTGAVFERVGVLEGKEIAEVGVLAIVGVALYAFAAFAIGLDLSDSPLYLAGVFFLLNTITFVHFAAGVLAGGMRRFSGFLDRYSRYLVLADMQSTTVLIALLFVVVLRPA